MNEKEIKKLIEHHIESIFKEIWKPIQDEIVCQIETSRNSISIFQNVIDSVNKRQRQVRRDYSNFTNQMTCDIRDMQLQIKEQKKNNDNLYTKTRDSVIKDINMAIEYGKKIEELYIQATEISKIDSEKIHNNFKLFIENAKNAIKYEADLRISDILKLEKRFEKLVSLSNEALKSHPLYKNVAEPINIIL